MLGIYRGKFGIFCGKNLELPSCHIPSPVFTRDCCHGTKYLLFANQTTGNSAGVKIWDRRNYHKKNQLEKLEAARAA